MGSRTCVIAAVVVALGLVPLRAAAGDTGSLAGSIVMTASLDRTQFPPLEPVTCQVRYENVCQDTLTMTRPGGHNYGYLEGQHFRLFDTSGQELTPTAELVLSRPAPEMDWVPVVLEPGEQYWALGWDPSIVGHEAHNNPGHYGLQMCYYYYDEHPPASINDEPDWPAALHAWREAHVKFLESNVVWFDRLDQQGEAKTPRLSLNHTEIADARPLRVGAVLYADSRALPKTDVSVDGGAGKVVVRRATRAVTLPLGKRSPKRDKQRPALIGAGGLVYLPLRQVATALGLRVNWDAATQTVDLRT